MDPIRIHTNRVSAALPPRSYLVDTIRDRSTLRSWWRVQADKATLASGAISSLAQIAGAASLPLAMATADKRPLYSDALFADRYPGAAFDGSNDAMWPASLPYTKTGPFTWVFIGTVREVAATGHIAALFATVGESTTLRVTVTTNAVTFQHGNGTATITPAGDEYLDVPLCIIASSDGTTLNLRVNGLDAAAAATNNTQTASTLVIGAANTSSLQPSAMDLAEFMVFQEAVLSDTEFRAAIEAYAVRCYGVAMA